MYIFAKCVCYGRSRKVKHVYIQCVGMEVGRQHIVQAGVGSGEDDAINMQLLRASSLIPSQYVSYSIENSTARGLLFRVTWTFLKNSSRAIR